MDYESFEKPTRRTFLKTLGASVASMSIPDTLRGEESVDGNPSFLFPNSLDYNEEKMAALLQDPRKVGELSPEDLEELFKFSQKIFSTIFGGQTLQDQLEIRNKERPERSNEIEARVLPEEFTDLGGLFVHSKDESKNVIYFNKKLTVAGALNTFIHEMMHGVLGPGEERVEFYNVLSQIAMFASKPLANHLELIKANKSLKFWKGAELDSFALMDMSYRTLPMTLIIMTVEDIKYHWPAFVKHKNANNAPELIQSYTKTMFFSYDDYLERIETRAEQLLLSNGKLDIENFAKAFRDACDFIFQFFQPSQDSKL